MNRTSLLAPSLLLAALAACSGRIDIGEPGSPQTDPAPATNAGAPAATPGSSVGVGATRTCQAEPSCDAGDSVVPSTTDCLVDDAACYTRSACGQEIVCTGPRPAPPSSPCRPGDVELPGPDACLKLRCYVVQQQGVGVWCEDRTSTGSCDAYPECRDGDAQVSSRSECLVDDAHCTFVNVCGDTILCTGPSR